MLPLIDRYLLQEIFKSLAAIILVLLLIFMGSTFIKLLQQVSVGDLNATLLFKMLGLEMFRFLGRLVPPAFFFAVLYAVGRMYRDSEITAMEACGVGGTRLFRGIMIASLPVILLVAWLAMVVAPWSARLIETLISEQTGLGYKAVVNHSHWGLIYENEAIDTLRPGQSLQGFIKAIRADLKIDISLRQTGHKGIDSLSNAILDNMQAGGGRLSVSDKSPAEEIYALFRVSKKRFKKAIGALYKRRLITMGTDGIRLPEKPR